jgi:hypothetical protein
MTKMLTSRISVVLAAALFAAATWMNTSLDTKTAPTTLVLAQPEQTLVNVASR